MEEGEGDEGAGGVEGKRFGSEVILFCVKDRFNFDEGMASDWVLFDFLGDDVTLVTVEEDGERSRSTRGKDGEGGEAAGDGDGEMEGERMEGDGGRVALGVGFVRDEETGLKSENVIECEKLNGNEENHTFWEVYFSPWGLNGALGILAHSV